MPHSSNPPSSLPLPPADLSAFEIVYAAHTASCTFLLDSDGICRRIVVAPKGKRSASRTAARCVGAQYVASLDGKAAGGLVEMPRVGAAMLFARVDENGRVSLVRTGTVVSFESNAGEDPFVETHSGTVETSAPELSSPPRSARAEELDIYHYDASERTQRIQALRPEDIAAALDHHEAQHEAEADAEEGHELATAEYRAVDVQEPSAMRRTPSTLRAAPRDATLDDSDEYAQAAPAAPSPAPAPAMTRTPLPRPSAVAPQGGAATARAYSPTSRPTPASDVQLSRRQRGT